MGSDEQTAAKTDEWTLATVLRGGAAAAIAAAVLAVAVDMLLSLPEGFLETALIAAATTAWLCAAGSLEAGRQRGAHARAGAWLWLIAAAWAVIPATAAIAYTLRDGGLATLACAGTALFHTATTPRVSFSESYATEESPVDEVAVEKPVVDEPAPETKPHDKS